MATWFTDQRKWLDALIAQWRNDPQHGEANTEVLDRIDSEWGARAEEAVRAMTAGTTDLLTEAVNA